MRSMAERSSLGLALATLVEACAMSGAGCEVVLGADFDDFRRGYAADGSAYAERPRDVSGGGAGGVDSDANGRHGGAVSDARSGPETGIEPDAGEDAEAGGGADGAGKTDASEPIDATRESDIFDDAVVRDATNDAGIYDQVPGHDTPHATSDAMDVVTDVAAPPRDGATGGSCTPNEVRSIATCGNCGLFLQICNAQGMWDLPFCRQEPGACAPGSTERRACPSGGTQVATCNASCTWSLGDCVAPPCNAGQTEVLSCALCGTQTRACVMTDAGFGWGPLSACAKQGVCAPGTRDVTTCGKCGTYSRMCSAKCAWEPWGACTGEGECLAGARETRDCVIIPFVLFGKQTRTCEASCSWSAFGNCK